MKQRASCRCWGNFSLLPVLAVCLISAINSLSFRWPPSPSPHLEPVHRKQVKDSHSLGTPRFRAHTVLLHQSGLKKKKCKSLEGNSSNVVVKTCISSNVVIKTCISSNVVVNIYIHTYQQFSICVVTWHACWFLLGDVLVIGRLSQRHVPFPSVLT